MKYRVAITKDGCIPPESWEEFEGVDHEDAAIAKLRSMKPRAEDFPIEVHVARSHKWPNGAPMITDAFKFDLEE